MNEGKNDDQNQDASSFTNNKNIFSSSSSRPRPPQKRGGSIGDISDISYLDEQHQSLICSIDCHDTRMEKAATSLVFLHSKQKTKKNDESRRTRCTDLQGHTQKEQNLGDNEKDEEYDEQHNTSNSSICNPPGDPEDTNMLRGKAGTDGRHNTTIDTKRRSDDEDNGEELEADERQCSSSSLLSLSSAGNTTSRKSIADQKQRGETVYMSHHTTTTTVGTPSRRSEGCEDNDAAGEVPEESGRQRTSLLSSLRNETMKRKAIDNHTLRGGATPVDRHSQMSDDEEKDDRELPEAERQRTSLHLLASRSITETTPRTSRRKLIRGESASTNPSSADLVTDDDERKVEEKGDALEVLGSQDCTRIHAFVGAKIQASSSTLLYNTPDISREDEKNEEERLDDVGRNCNIVTNTAHVVGAKMQASDDHDRHTLAASENIMNTDYTTMKDSDNDNTLEEAGRSQIPIPNRENTSEQEGEERQQKQDTSNDKLGHQSSSPHDQEDDYRTKVRNLARQRRRNAEERNKTRQEEITRLTKANFELKEKNQQMINELVTLGVDALTIQLFLNSIRSANQQSSVLVPPPTYNLSPF